MDRIRSSSISRSSKNTLSTRALIASPVTFTSVSPSKNNNSNKKSPKDTRGNPPLPKSPYTNEIKKQFEPSMLSLTKKINSPAISIEKNIEPVDDFKTVTKSLKSKIFSLESKAISNVSDFSTFNIKPNLKPKSSINEACSSDHMIEKIKRRLNGLKLLQIKSAQLEAKYYEDLYLLECKYNNYCKSLKDLRRKIVNGEHEPSDDECRLVFINGDGDSIDLERNDDICQEREISKDLLALSISNYSKNKAEIVKGIPEFWLSVLKRVDLINQMIEEYDEPILKYLIDIDIDLKDKKPYSFTLKFYFSPNEFFNETLLTKSYFFKIDIDSNEPFLFEAPETQGSIGSKITWKKGKNVTMKKVDKKQNSNSKMMSQPIEEKQISFFNFFSTSQSDESESKLSKEEEAELAIDYEIGYTFKEKVIPRAILYYMGEISDENDDSQFGSSDSNQLEDDDEDNFDEEDFLRLRYKSYLTNQDICESKNQKY